MEDLWDLVRDNQSATGRVVTSAVVVAVAIAAALIGGRLMARRADDAQSRYYARKVVRYLTPGRGVRSPRIGLPPPRTFGRAVG